MAQALQVSKSSLTLAQQKKNKNKMTLPNKFENIKLKDHIL